MFERTLVLRALIHCLPLLSTSQVHLLFKAQLKCLLLQAGFEDPNYSSSQTRISSAREWVNPTLGADWRLNPTMRGLGKAAWYRDPELASEGERISASSEHGDRALQEEGRARTNAGVCERIEWFGELWHVPYD